MTDARSIEIADALTADQETMNRLLTLSAAEAAGEFGRMGYDFTSEELDEFRNEVVETAKRMGESGELDEEVLSSVSGGCGKCFVVGAAVGLMMIAGGVW